MVEKSDKNRHLAFAIALMIVFALTRIPGVIPENFSAAYAIAFCAGVYFPGALAWWLPLATFFITDIILNLFYYNASLFSLYMLAVYGVYALIIFTGKKIGRKASFITLLGGGIAGALLFYLITNTISWIADPGYPKTFSGWIQALTTGLPGYPPTWVFFKNTLLSGGIFTGLFAGSMKIAEQASEEKETEEEPAQADEPAEEESAEKARS
ncbi:MAG: DUF6580 family putative transport protein [Verrucomicrobiia bacterium]